MAEASQDPDCLFCKIVAGAIPVERLYEDDLVLAFPDINPQAPKHLLVLPKSHLTSTENALSEHAPIFGAIFAAVPQLAKQQGLTSGYRLVVNTGRDGGQTVPHLHVHLLGGRKMSWPPG